MTLSSLLPWILLAAMGVVLGFTLRRTPRGGEEGVLQAQLKQEQSEKDKLSGQNKQLYEENVRQQAKCEALAREQDALKERIAGFVAKEEHREKEFHNNVAELRAAKQSLEDEKMRVRREDEEGRRQEEEERDRMWKEHEQTVLSLLVDLCKRPDCLFKTYTNKNLPVELDGSLEPDFMIELLGQYVIFDAKVSKAKNLQVYINDTVKKTVQKVKGNEKIAKMIFLVVPTCTIGELKSHVLFQEGYTLYVVSPEALAPILASLKRIEHYEFAEKIDPEERENIIHLIAKLDTHINFRNTFDILMAKQGAQVLHEAQRLDPELAQEVAQEKAKIRTPTFKPSDVKKLMNGEARKQEVENLTLPRAAISKSAVETVGTMFVED